MGFDFESQYQAQFEPLKSEYPQGSEVFSNGKLYTVVDWGFEGSQPIIIGVDREGQEMHLLTYEAVRYKVCSRCGGRGRYSWNAMHGSVCYGCSGVGKQPIAPSGIPQKIKAICRTDWSYFGYVSGDHMNAEFCGFSKTGGTPLYSSVNKRTHVKNKLRYSSIMAKFDRL
ncbi:hypothetical protein [Paenibacillus polymyxa]|uniref:hypothetical protein n=1 Tax=Paenibacillus polymyxa TaxID=1406 RepID=UPI0006C26246|nr:hypothetical protein [Paenibacillus polymyxa]KOS01387.1 hypothetical protein AM598_17860 [Paenibacillus polymyxa]